MVALQRQLGSEEEEAVCPLQSSSLQGEQVLHCRALLNGDTGDAEHNQAREPDGTTHLTRRNHRIRAPPPPAAGPRKAPPPPAAGPRKAQQQVGQPPHESHRAHQRRTAIEHGWRLAIAATSNAKPAITTGHRSVAARPLNLIAAVGVGNVTDASSAKKMMHAFVEISRAVAEVKLAKRLTARALNWKKLQRMTLDQ